MAEVELPKPLSALSTEALFRYCVVVFVLTREALGDARADAIVRAVDEPHLSATGVIRAVSRRTLYRWLGAYERGGFGALELHLLALDGVYVEDEQGELGFHALGAPSSAEVADIAQRTARRVHQAFKKKGRTSPWDEEHAVVDSGETDPLSVEQPGLFACYQAAAAGVAVSGERAGQPLMRWVAGGRAEPERGGDNTEPSTEPVAEVLGVNLYAKQRVDGRDSQQLERLCRYVMRPPLS